MVMHLDLDTLLIEQQANLRADVLQRVGRRHREVAALDRRPVREVPCLVLDSGRPGSLFRLDLYERAGHVDAPRDRIEDEKFGLRAEVRGIAQSGRLQIRLGALGERTWVAVVALAGRRLDHVAGDDQRVFLAERIHARRGRIRHQQHVRRFDSLPPADRRAVERVTVLELVLLERLGRHRHVLFLALCIGEAQIDEQDLVVRDHFHDVFGRRHSFSSITRG